MEEPTKALPSGEVDTTGWTVLEGARKPVSKPPTVVASPPLSTPVPTSTNGTLTRVVATLGGRFLGIRLWFWLVIASPFLVIFAVMLRSPSTPGGGELEISGTRQSCEQYGPALARSIVSQYRRASVESISAKYNPSARGPASSDDPTLFASCEVFYTWIGESATVVGLMVRRSDLLPLYWGMDPLMKRVTWTVDPLRDGVDYRPAEVR